MPRPPEVSSTLKFKVRRQVSSARKTRGRAAIESWFCERTLSESIVSEFVLLGEYLLTTPSPGVRGTPRPPVRRRRRRRADQEIPGVPPRDPDSRFPAESIGKRPVSRFPIPGQSGIGNRLKSPQKTGKRGIRFPILECPGIKVLVDIVRKVRPIVRHLRVRGSLKSWGEGGGTSSEARCAHHWCTQNPQFEGLKAT